MHLCILTCLKSDAFIIEITADELEFMMLQLWLPRQHVYICCSCVHSSRPDSLSALPVLYDVRRLGVHKAADAVLFLARPTAL